MIHVYPGMGGTSAMFGPEWRQSIRGQYHDWPSLEEPASLRQLAVQLIERHNIQDGDQVIGTSLGGIVACEIARIRRLDRLVLISSAAHPREIHSLLEFFHPLIHLTPLRFLNRCADRIPSELTRMFAQNDPRFIRAMVRAIFDWEGAAADTPMLRLHGKWDFVIPAPSRIDHLINGGHLIVMTHATACLRLLHPHLGDSSAQAIPE